MKSSDWSSRIAILADLATIAAAVVAIFALKFGYIQLRETEDATRQTLSLTRDGLELQRESQAIEQFGKFNELMIEWRGRRVKAHGQEAFWRSNMTMAITESIFRLRGKDDPGWRATVLWMLDQDTTQVRNLDCATFDSAFVALIRQKFGANPCVR